MHGSNLCSRSQHASNLQKEHYLQEEHYPGAHSLQTRIEKAHIGLARAQTALKKNPTENISSMKSMINDMKDISCSLVLAQKLNYMPWEVLPTTWWNKERMIGRRKSQTAHKHRRNTLMQGHGSKGREHSQVWQSTAVRGGSDCRKLFCWQERLVLTVLNKMAELRASDWLCPNTLLLILEVHRKAPEQHGNEIKSWLVFKAHKVQTVVQSVSIPYAVFWASLRYSFLCSLGGFVSFQNAPLQRGSAIRASSHLLSSLLPFPVGSLQEFL